MRFAGTVLALASFVFCNSFAGRRTYRAHGRINPYMSMPCHVELILAEKEAAVKSEQVWWQDSPVSGTAQLLLSGKQTALPRDASISGHAAVHSGYAKFGCNVRHAC